MVKKSASNACDIGGAHCGHLRQTRPTSENCHSERRVLAGGICFSARAGKQQIPRYARDDNSHVQHNYR